MQCLICEFVVYKEIFGEVDCWIQFLRKDIHRQELALLTKITWRLSFFQNLYDLGTLQMLRVNKWRTHQEMKPVKPPPPPPF